MSDIDMGDTSSIQPQAHASPPNPANLSSHPTTDSRVTFEATRFDDQASQASSPSLASTMAGPSRDDQPSGEELQAIPKSKLVESGSDYAHIFDELQIKLEHYDEIVTGILHPIRARRIKNLKSASAAMIRDLSSTFIRGYGNILYKKNPEKWLIDHSELQLAGKTRIPFTPGDMRVNGPNAHFYAILEPMWWIMRGIVFELKPAPKRRGHPLKKKVEVEDSEAVWQGEVDAEMDMQDLPHKERGEVAARPRGRPPKAGTQAGTQARTGWEAARAKAAEEPKIRFEEKQQKALERIEREIDWSKRNRGWGEKWSMTAEETDEAVQELIARLHEIRCESEPKAFERSWEMNLARLDEIETIGELKVGRSVELEDGVQRQSLAMGTSVLEEVTSFKKVKLSGTASPQKATAPSQIPSRAATLSGTAPIGAIFSTSGEQDPPRTMSISNLANEPFNTTGPPSILNKLTLGHTPLVPSSISIYISTNPPLRPYHNNAYHWPSAPIGIADCKRLFDGIDQRVNVVKINGYTLSYGWDDMMRAVEATEQGRRYGFGMLLRDVSEAARMGVTRFRLKVLVRGMAPAYQGRV